MGQSLGRRGFIRGIGAAFGLEALLCNLEAAAEGAASPPRLLVVHHPIGSVRPYWMPNGSGTTYTTSQLLSPFDSNLRSRMIAVSGLSLSGIPSNGGGAHETGTVAMMTGVAPLGCRYLAQAGDACASGPSFDQIFRARATALQRPAGSLNVICDARTDFGELSTQCLSYGYEKQPVVLLAGKTALEAVPAKPTLSPLTAYTNLFANFVPGGATASNIAAVEQVQKSKKSVLDLALTEIGKVETLAPASAKSRLEAHLAAVRDAELQLQAALASSPAVCSSPAAPPNISGMTGAQGMEHYFNPKSNVNDMWTHEVVARAHWSIIKAAFVCDLIRVATFQFSPGTNHVSFGGLFPGDAGAYYHHPVSHRLSPEDFASSTPPASPNPNLTFLFNVERWYNTLVADLVLQLATTRDVFGNSLLDNTVIPYLTELGTPTNDTSSMNALIFGGSRLGMRGGQYIPLTNQPHNDLWLTIAQAFGLNLAHEGPQFSGPIAGLWSAPP